MIVIDLVSENFPIKVPSNFWQVLARVSYDFLLDNSLVTNQQVEIKVALDIINDEKMTEINLEYRNKNKTTDVLSFPIFEDLSKEFSLIKNLPIIELGDLFISCDVLKKQALEFNLEDWEELLQLFFHGFLHLLGFDHERSEADQVLMENHEQTLFNMFSSSLSI